MNFFEVIQDCEITKCSKSVIARRSDANIDAQQCIVLKIYVSYVLRRVHALAGRVSGLSFSMQSVRQCGVSAVKRDSFRF